jgi:hypothetical protein
MGWPLDFVKARLPPKNAKLDSGQQRSNLLLVSDRDVPEAAHESSNEDGRWFWGAFGHAEASRMGLVQMVNLESRGPRAVNHRGIIRHLASRPPGLGRR